MDLGGDQFIVIADRKVELDGPGASACTPLLYRTKLLIDNAFIAASLLLDLEAVQLDPRVVKFAQKYKLVFSLLNEDAASGDALLDWDIENLLHRTHDHCVPWIPLTRLRRSPPTSPHFARTAAQLHGRDPHPILCTLDDRYRALERGRSHSRGRAACLRQRGRMEHAYVHLLQRRPAY